MRLPVRILSQGVPAACIVLAVFTIVQNWHSEVTIMLGPWEWHPVALGLALLVMVLLGCIAMFFNLFETQVNLHKELLQYEHRRDHAEVEAESSYDKVAALEAKIETLEQALEKALADNKDT